MIPRRHPSILWALALVLAHMVVFFGLGRGLVGPALGLSDPMAGGPAALAALAILAALDYLVVVRLGLRRMAGLTLTDLGWRRPAPRDLAIGLLGLAIALALLLALIAAFTGGHVGFVFRKVAGFTPQQRLLFLAIGASAAFFEETLFRGALQPALQAKLGRWPGLVAGAMIFALYHLNFRPLGLAGKLALGLIYGVEREATRGLPAAALTHALVWVVLGTV
jgi:membrane protease YdiL (CAAX protease family)